MEWHFGSDFRAVRVHAGSDAAESAASFGARAYAAGEHIVFAAGQFRPQARAGLWLLAHELAHVCQQRTAGGPLILRGCVGDRTCEWWADRAADWVLRGRQLPPRFRLPPTPPGSIQCHSGPPCPQPPDWEPLTDHRPRHIWLPANQAIEQAFANDRQTRNHVALFGSQFNVGPRSRILTPKGTPNKKLADEFLNRLTGIANQLAPDIIDFTDRVFYEIKTAGFIQDGIRALSGYYNTIEAIRRDLGPAGGPPWDQQQASWYPPHTLAFPGDPKKQVCTQQTDYTLPSRRGLIVYGVLQRMDDEERARRKVVAAKQLTITDLAPELEPLRERIQAVMRRVVPEADPKTEFRLVGSADFVKAMIIEPARAREEMLLNWLRVKGFDLRNPVIQVRVAGWGIIGIAVGLWAMAPTVALILVAFPETVAAAPPASAAAGAGGAGSATLSLRFLQGVKAANDNAQLTQKAAGVLFLVGSFAPSEADAAQPRPTLSTARVVPTAAVQPQGDFNTGRNVTVGGIAFQEFGKAMSGNGEA
jgi:hypothetical protein